jgi:hypothetical protein
VGQQTLTKSWPYPSDLADTLSRFSKDSDLILSLAARSETFRSLCEDYATAKAALQRFEASFADQKAKVADYRNVVVELERDIESMLNETKRR